MTSDQRSRDLWLLGLDADADDAEVIAAYHRRSALYDVDNLATYSLLTPEARQLLLAEFEAALNRLTGEPRRPKTEPKSSIPIIPGPEPAAGPEPDRNESPGAFLKYNRLVRGISLVEVARETKIAEPSLEAIESEDPDHLPAAVYVRGFVVNFARLLGLPDPEGLARAHLKKIFDPSGGKGRS